MDAETVVTHLVLDAGRSASRHRTAVTVPSAFGRVLRDQRIARGLSQEALALRAEVDRKYLSRIECGISYPTLVTMCKLADALDISLSKLIERTEHSV